MNISSFLAIGAAYAPSDSTRRQKRIDDAAEQARSNWCDALLVDQTRAWLGIGERDMGVLSAFAVILTLAAFVQAYEASEETPDLRIIRGAISAAGQCSKAGGVITVQDAQAFSSAAQRADTIIRGASVGAITYAAKSINGIFQ